MSPVTIGIDVEVVEEARAVVPPTAIDPAFLVHSGVDEVETFTNPDDLADATTDDALVAMGDAFFKEGGASLTVAPLLGEPGGSGSGSGDADALEESLDALPADLGPGQLMVPEVTTGAEMAYIAERAWDANRLYLADGPADATDSALQDLAETMRASAGARNASVWADTLLIPGLVAGTTRSVPASIVEAALMARLDRAQGNPGLAAAGVNGIARYVIGIDSERNASRRDALAEYGVNTFRTLYGQSIRAYGYRTVADADEYPLWWNVSGSRVIMAVRAREAVVAENHMFGNIDREGAFLSSYEAGLTRELAALQKAGALWGSATDPGYRVQAGWDVNPPAELAQGRVRAIVYVRIAPFAEMVRVQIIRRAITQPA